MAEAPRKPRAKVDKLTIPPVVEEEVAKLEQDVDETVALAKQEMGKLEGLTADELRQLHQDALFAESEAKKELYLLRQRAAMMATTVSDEVEQEIIAAKAKLAEAGSWLHSIEQKLVGELKDIWGNTF